MLLLLLLFFLHKTGSFPFRYRIFRQYNILKYITMIIISDKVGSFPHRNIIRTLSLLRRVYKTYSDPVESRIARPSFTRHPHAPKEIIIANATQHAACRSATFTGRVFRGRHRGGVHQDRRRRIT